MTKKSGFVRRLTFYGTCVFESYPGNVMKLGGDLIKYEPGKLVGKEVIVAVAVVNEQQVYA